MPQRILIVCLLWWGCWCAPAWGQRTQFPSSRAVDSPAFRDPDVSLGGNILPPEGSWDPYSDAGPAQPNVPLYGPPQDPYAPQTQYPWEQPWVTGPPNQRFISNIRAEYTYLHGTSGNTFQVQDFDFSATATFPFLYDVAPLLVTPGFGAHLWSGPDGVDYGLPPRVYDLYLDIGWRPQVTEWLGFDLGVRPGLYTDFSFIDDRAFRVQARALALFTLSPEIQIVAGFLYIDRYYLKALPAGGVIWTPNEDTRYEILFPRPKLSQRLATYGNTDWWVYVAGEYGGGAWSFTRPAIVPGTPTGHEAMDYNDFRVYLGTEFQMLSGVRGLFEFGYVFGRELKRKNVSPVDFFPKDTFMFRGGVVF